MKKTYSKNFGASEGASGIKYYKWRDPTPVKYSFIAMSNSTQHEKQVNFR
jgi:hypothetical protein